MATGGIVRVALLGLMLTVGACAMSCGGSSLENRELVLGDIGWDESIAISNLTKVLLEEELGYGSVELRTMDVAPLYEGVGDGTLDAFQDVWLPAHDDYVGGVEDDVELLDTWFMGTTRFGIAAPGYMDVASLDQLNQTGAEDILGIEPGAVSMTKIPEEVAPAYALEQSLVEASTPGMLSEVEKRYNNREEFAFIAWSPHWMNQRYDLVYLDDPKDAFEDVDDPAQLATVVNEGLRYGDPVAFAFLDALTLTEEQVNGLEDVITEIEDPREGARRWATANPEVVQPWLDAAEAAWEDTA